MDPQPGRDRRGRFVSDDTNARGAFIKLSEVQRILLAFMANPAMDAAERERLANEGVEMLAAANAWIDEVDAPPTPRSPDEPEERADLRREQGAP